MRYNWTKAYEHYLECPQCFPNPTVTDHTKVLFAYKDGMNEDVNRTSRMNDVNYDFNISALTEDIQNSYPNERIEVIQACKINKTFFKMYNKLLFHLSHRGIFLTPPFLAKTFPQTFSKYVSKF